MLLSLVLCSAILAQAGKGVFEKRCTGCHAADSDRVGPKLRGIVGRKAGAEPGFPYSDSIKASQVVWNAEALDKWLADPDQFMPGNDMSFRVPKAEERLAIVEYLRALK